MRLRLHAVLVGLVALLAVGLVAPTPAGAVTGGQIDSTDQYSNVGMIAFYTDEGRFRCTATLVTPTVLITAAHCTDGTLGKTIVSFTRVIAEQPPSPLPRAADDDGLGTSKVGYGSMSGEWLSGKAVTHPDYSDFTDMKNWNDVGVVLLDQPVTNLTPAKLAPQNHLDRYAQPKLNHTYFRLVGYGTEVRKPDSGPQKPTPMSYPLLRRYTDVVGQKLTPQILQVNGNPNDTRGGGGSCFGDSGGPTFIDDRLVTVTSYGYTENCRYLDGLQRVDIPVVQSWLAKFKITPAA
jgi:Trypsin